MCRHGPVPCWHLSVLNQVAGLLDNARKLDLRGREIDFRVRHLIAKKLLEAAIDGEAAVFTAGGRLVINLLQELLLVPTGSSDKGFDPTGEKGGSWAGCLCHAMLSA